MKQQHDRRKELLDSIVYILLKDGVADLSLRPLAKAVGTSARLLIYHFETKENLLVCALDEVRDRIATSLRALPDFKRSGRLKDSLLRFWNWATAAENQNYFRLLFEVDGLRMYGQLNFSSQSRLDSTEVWLQLMGEPSAMDKAALARATLVIAAMTGLLQEFLSTGDRERTSASLSVLIDALTGWEPAASVKKQGRAAT